MNQQLKFKILLLSIPILLIVIYRFAIALTIEERKTNNRLMSTISKAQLANELDSTTRLFAKTDPGIVRIFTMDTLDQGKRLFELIADNHSEDGLNMTDYSIAALDTSSNPIVITRKITVQGEYADILQLLYELENKNQVGRLQSAILKSYTDPQGEFAYLEASFFIQNLLQHEKKY